MNYSEFNISSKGKSNYYIAKRIKREKNMLTEDILSASNSSTIIESVEDTSSNDYIVRPHNGGNGGETISIIMVMTVFAAIIKKLME